MTHTALYRKYRPHSFDEVRDQEHIVSVLKSAIEKDAIPHALLFSGGRGTGKTTLARIFASALNTNEEDVYEIDAASNRGIDDIRALKEAVYTAPYNSKYKVYIIDEVHMLTKEAFNALLKTLEEPPAHVIFILATTEVDKLLDTIISRCQVFTMRAPSRAVLAKMLIEVAKKESVTLLPEAADLIALAADGSFRDALSILQKVLLLEKDKVGEVDEVAAVIGAPKRALLGQFVEALAKKDTSAALAALHSARESHIDIELFTRLVLEQVRFTLLLRNAPEIAQKECSHLSDDECTHLSLLSKTHAATLNSHLVRALLEAVVAMRGSVLPHIALELVVLEQKAE